MKALIFAAGIGSRLRPLTDFIPKALVEVDGEPMLQRVIMKLKNVGVTHFVINVHHFASKIKNFLQNNDNFGVDIDISDESQMLLETGGGLLKARHLLDDGEPFIVHNADILTDFDITSMIDSHVTSGSDVTLLVDRRKSSRQLLFDSKMRMRGWTNVTTGEVLPDGMDISALTPYAFGGVHIISPTKLYPLLERFAESPKFSITPFYASNCSDLAISGYKPEEDYGWFDIGKVEQLEKTADYLRSK